MYRCPTSARGGAGAGTVGWNAARLAAAMDAEVMLLDRSPERLRSLEDARRGRLMSVVSSRGLLERLVPRADLLIGAVLTPGGRAPTLVDEAMVQQMKPGSVIVDVAIDQGGCVATSRETTHTDPTVTIDGVQHYAVGNMPGAVPFTSTEALVSVTLPYILGIAGRGLEEAVTERPELLSGLNTVQGAVFTRRCQGSRTTTTPPDGLLALKMWQVGLGCTCSNQDTIHVSPMATEFDASLS